MIFGDETGNNTHCRLCGSLLYSVVRDGAFVHVAMGTLVDDPGIRPSRHIFVGSKAPWFTITDACPSTTNSDRRGPRRPGLPTPAGRRKYRRSGRVRSCYGKSHTLGGLWRFRGDFLFSWCRDSGKLPALA